MKPDYENKFIAHCIDDGKQDLGSKAVSDQDQIILIGPEGDFTEEEIETAIQKNYIPVSLGKTRLRTETAGIAAAVLIKIKILSFSFLLYGNQKK